MSLPCDCGPRGSGRERSDRPALPDWEPLEKPPRFPADWLVRCTRCERRYAVCVIPHGGIYSDYDWRALED